MISVDPAVLGAAISFITLLALIGGGFFWLGKLDNRVSQVEQGIKRVDSRIEQVDQKIDKLAEDIHEDMRSLRGELLEEMRRGNQQLLIALANHGHDEGGQPVFRVPVNSE